MCSVQAEGAVLYYAPPVGLSVDDFHVGQRTDIDVEGSPGISRVAGGIQVAGSKGDKHVIRIVFVNNDRFGKSTGNFRIAPVQFLPVQAAIL